jgi:hypothetical protein
MYVPYKEYCHIIAITVSRDVFLQKLFVEQAVWPDIGIWEENLLKMTALTLKKCTLMSMYNRISEIRQKNYHILAQNEVFLRQISTKNWPNFRPICDYPFSCLRVFLTRDSFCCRRTRKMFRLWSAAFFRFFKKLDLFNEAVSLSLSAICLFPQFEKKAGNKI